jgi:hypothetical protein
MCECLYAAATTIVCHRHDEHICTQQTHCMYLSMHDLILDVQVHVYMHINIFMSYHACICTCNTVHVLIGHTMRIYVYVHTVSVLIGHTSASGESVISAHKPRPGHCMYVYVCVCMCVCMCICMYVCVYVFGESVISAHKPRPGHCMHVCMNVRV